MMKILLLALLLIFPGFLSQDSTIYFGYAIIFISAFAGFAPEIKKLVDKIKSNQQVVQQQNRKGESQ